MKSEDVYGGKKEFAVVTPNLLRATASETLLAMREELEAERKRRMEDMNSHGQDEDTRIASAAKKGVNEELLHLFAFHDVSDKCKIRSQQHSLVPKNAWESGSQQQQQQ